jgi:membrane associated rhomboid family serine protease
LILRLASNFRRAMDLSLVLDQEGIPHELRSIGEEQWGLFVEDAFAEPAAAALSAFERENEPVPVVEVAPLTSGVAAGLLFGLPLLAFQLWTGPESNDRWFSRGSADAAAIVAGEWWRSLTALTLHADAGHAAGNVLLGGLFVALLARRVGTGLSLLLPLVAGALGTAFGAALIRRDFVSIGASTAVFAALGALALLPGRRRLQIAAGLAMLGYLGTGKRADLLGHLCGFVFGLLVGALASFVRPTRDRALQALFGATALLAPVAAWIRALR